MNRRDGVHCAAYFRPVMVGLLLLCAAGCSPNRELPTEYGRRRGRDGGPSVNGTAVLAHLFEQEGWSTSSWRRLSPRLDREQTILWAPDRHTPPTANEINYLEDWLNHQPGRTLVYIGRDYDASIDFWRAVSEREAGGQPIEQRRRFAQAIAEQIARRSEEGDDNACRWFKFERLPMPVPVTSLEGEWSEQIDVESAAIQLASLIQIPNRSEGDDGDPLLRYHVLLSSDDRILAVQLWKEHWDSSQIIVIANGSWLLNFPLINHQHRQLAGKLVDACGPPDRVCFLESGPQPLRISDSDANLPLLVRILTIAPFNVIFLHLTFLGILFCFAVFPIFGRPRSLPEDRLSDFGKHVGAVGDLLENSRETDYAHQQLRTFRETVLGKTKGKPS